MHRKAGWRASIAAMITAGALAISAVPAMANDNGSCEAGEFCGYSLSNFDQSIGDWNFDVQGEIDNNPIGDAMRFLGSFQIRVDESNDDFESAWNRRSVCIRLYEHEFQGGRILDIPVGDQRPSFPPSPGTLLYLPPNTPSSFGPASC